MRALTLFVVSVTSLVASEAALASPTFPPAIQTSLALQYVPPCAICHEGGRGGSGTVTTWFGRALMERGLVSGDLAALASALSKLDRDKIDSDGDGRPDTAQLKAGKDPNGATGNAIGAPPVEYGCGGATIARTRRTDDDAFVYATVMAAAVLARRRRWKAPLLALAALVIVSCSPYEVSYVAPEVCQSGRLWTGGESGSERMNPGLPCIDCHAKREAPRFTIAGTLFASSDEKDRCAGTNGAKVFVQGEDGRVLALVPNDTGNFYSSLPIVPAKVWIERADGKRHEMVARPAHGDCNGCHTQRGSNGAPGRIVLP